MMIYLILSVPKLISFRSIGCEMTYQELRILSFYTTTNAPRSQSNRWRLRTMVPFHFLASKYCSWTLRILTKTYVKLTIRIYYIDTLVYHNCLGNRYTRSLLTTMLDLAH